MVTKILASIGAWVVLLYFLGAIGHGQFILYYGHDFQWSNACNERGAAK